jgi:hypothetical protein
MPREIITLQLGGYSNFIGSHFWNIQEECMSYDHDEDSKENSEVRSDILWRQTSSTVVPRLMTLDLKSERGALRRMGYLYPEMAHTSQEALQGDPSGLSANSVDFGAWGGAVASIYMDPIAVHPFVQHIIDTDAQEYEDEDEDDEYLEEDEEDEGLRGNGMVGSRPRGQTRSTSDGSGGSCDKDDKDEGEEEKGKEAKELKPDFIIEDDTVRYWSDYLKVSFHPQTCHDLTQGFGTDYTSYCAGVNWDADDTLRQEWEDSFHWWVEECDTLQGLHILADTDTAFGAIAGRICSQLHDDFPRLPLVLVAAAPDRAERTAAQTRMHASAEAISLATLLPSANIYTPVHGPQGTAQGHVSTPTGMQALPARPSFYRTSALAAAALDTCSLPWRRRRTASAAHVELLSTTAALFHGHEVAALQTYMPVAAVSVSALEMARAAAKQAGKQDEAILGVHLKSLYMNLYMQSVYASESLYMQF